MIKLFEVGEDGMAMLNKEWISLIPEFKKLLSRNRDGRTRDFRETERTAQKEFTYIYLMYDFQSPFENFPEAQRMEEALRCSGLEKGRINSDGNIWEAIRMYQKLQAESSVTLKTYRELRDSADDLTAYIKTMDLSERTETGGKVHSPKDKQDAINGMPKVIETLQKMEEAVKQELTGEVGLRGDATKGFDEDPE